MFGLLGHDVGLHSFPTRRSSDLSHARVTSRRPGVVLDSSSSARARDIRNHRLVGCRELARQRRKRVGDRKSTRLNSSHSQISYAVFCLKKKKIKCWLHCSSAPGV